MHPPWLNLYCGVIIFFVYIHVHCYVCILYMAYAKNNEDTGVTSRVKKTVLPKHF